MPALLDVNVVLALIYEGHSHHAVATAWVDTITTDASLTLCRISQFAILRLLNNPVVMGADVKRGREAWKIWDTLLLDDRFIFADEPRDFDSHFRLLTSPFKEQPKRWQDAALAAFALAAGLELITFDTGFRSYAGLRHHLLGP